MAGLVESIARAIARMEGYYLPGGSIAARNHNPGNLRAGPRQVGVDSTGYGIYRADSDGWLDLETQIQRNINRGLNLYEFFGGKTGVYPGYAPEADNNKPSRYARFVSSQVGIPADVPLTQLQAAGSAVAPAALWASAPVAASASVVPATALVASGPVDNPLLAALSAANNAQAPEAAGWVWVALAVAAGVAVYLWWGEA